MVPIYFRKGTKVRIKNKDHSTTRNAFGYNRDMKSMKGRIFKITYVLHHINGVHINGYTWKIDDIELENEQELQKNKPKIFHFDSSQL